MIKTLNCLWSNFNLITN